MQLVGTLNLILEKPDFYIAYFNQPGKLIHELSDSNGFLEIISSRINEKEEIWRLS
jgi:hypothetical protein